LGDHPAKLELELVNRRPKNRTTKIKITDDLFALSSPTLIPATQAWPGPFALVERYFSVFKRPGTS